MRFREVERSFSNEGVMKKEIAPRQMSAEDQKRYEDACKYWDNLFDNMLKKNKENA